MKSILRKLALTGATLVSTAVVVFGSSGVANAAITVTNTSPNGLAYGSTAIGFRSEGYASWADIYLNDRCPGDGVRARMDLYIQQYGRTIKVGSREDVGGCESDPYRGSAHWASGGPITLAGMRVCSSGGCSGIKWVGNPY